MRLIRAEEDLNDLPGVEPIPATAVRYVFTLVPGTWAGSWLFTLIDRISGSIQWYEEGSRFRAELKKQFPDAIFEPSKWSGANSARARLKAAINLASDLRTRLTNHPHAHHFIIGHSHGGNIAAYALINHPEFEHKIRGLIFLSTPFLHIHKRPTNPIREAASVALLFLGMFLALARLPWVLGIFLLIIYASAKWLYFWTPDRTVVEIILPYLSGISIISAWTSWIEVGIVILLLAGAVWLQTGFKRSIRNLAVTMSYVTETLPPSLIIRTAGDEASAALTLCQVGIWLMSKYQEFLMVPLLFAEMIASKIDRSLFVRCIPPAWLVYAGQLLMVFGFFVFLTLPLVFLSALSDSMASVWDNISDKTNHILTDIEGRGHELQDILLELIGPGLKMVILLLLIAVWDLIVLIPSVIGPLLSVGTLGKEFAFGYLFVDVSVEVAPPGSYTIHQYTPGPDLKDRIKARLNHSIAYQSPQVIATITGWIRTLIRSD